MRAALVVVLCVALAACSVADDSSSSSSSPATTPRSSSSTTTAPGWAKIDRALSRLGADVGLLAARVSPDGSCNAVHETGSTTARPIGSQFKLFVLGALAAQVRAGHLSWDQTLTVAENVKSLGNGQGSLQLAAAGTSVSVEDAATKMISISDNTAADMLIALVGRERVEQQVRRRSAHASANEPFLTTREMFLLHYVAGLADRYLATPRTRRAAFLAASVDPLPLDAIASGFSTDPRYVDEIEWFASPADICRAFAGSQQLSKQPALSRSLSSALSPRSGRDRVGPLGLADGLVQGRLGARRPDARLARDEPRRRDEAMVSNADEILAPDAITDLVDLGKDAFALLG